MNTHTESILVHGTTAAELTEQIAAAVLAALTPVIESTRDRGLLSREEMADFLGVSQSKVDDLVRRGAVRSIPVGKCRRFDADEVLADLRALRGDEQ